MQNIKGLIFQLRYKLMVPDNFWLLWFSW